MIRKTLLISLLSWITWINAQQVTGLSDWTIFVDPGHSQYENMGIYNYSEAQKVLRIALYLQYLLETKTDISAVYLSRTNDQQQVSLSQRTDLANSLGTDWYHSIHSDAGSPSTNRTLLLHGGWQENGVVVEKTPHGGKAMSDIMVDILTRAMRIETSGNYADRTFYEGFINHTRHYPYLHVNRESNMASELSEGGHHTSPIQNVLNMNADWKKIEAYAIFWTILKYHHLQRPSVNIVTGIVHDIESQLPVNGAVITINDTSYTTDTYESLFYKYSTDPQQLANGFYFLDGFNQDSVEINVSAAGYYPQSRMVALSDTFFTFADFDLISSTPPFIISSSPVPADTNVLDVENIKINFSRPMNRASVENNFSIDPAVDGVFSWSSDDRQLTFHTFLDFSTEYTVTIDTLAEDKYAHKLDGDGDSLSGGQFVLHFKTGFDDVAPVITSTYPVNLQQDIELQPVISYQYNEIIDPQSFISNPIELSDSETKELIPGQFNSYNVNEQTVIHFYPDQKLQPSKIYKSRIQAGLSDIHGNATAAVSNLYFTTTENDVNISGIEDFDGNFMDYWWQPSASGSTTGIKGKTGVSFSDSVVNLLTGSTKSMRLEYEWDLGSNSWLIREYLSGGTPRNKTFDTSYRLQVYIFGDGSNTKFRFALDEGTTSDWPNHEVSVWYTIDWIGWRLVEWDLSDPEMVGSWIGNGQLDLARYRIDSFQLAYDNSENQGIIYFDDLRLVKSTPAVNIENPLSEIPKNYFLGQNYPNPFNPSTKIEYHISNPGNVLIDVFNSLGQKVITLVDNYHTAGKYSVTFNANGYAAGTYIVRMRINNKFFLRKMTLLK